MKHPTLQHFRVNSGIRRLVNEMSALLERYGAQAGGYLPTTLGVNPSAP